MERLLLLPKHNNRFQFVIVQCVGDGQAHQCLPYIVTIQWFFKDKTYRSSEWAERGFCADCGTHLFYHLLPSNEYILPAGLFQNETFHLSSEIFIDEKPDFYQFANDTQKLTRQQVFEQFSAENPD